jgi:hypothetical protein
MIYIGITTSLVSGTRSCSPPSSATDARDQNAHGRTGYCKNVYAGLLARACAELPRARLRSCGPDGYLRRNVIARSSAHVELGSVGWATERSCTSAASAPSQGVRGSDAVALAVENCHLPCVVALACHGLVRHRALDRCDIVGRELDLERA